MSPRYRSRVRKCQAGTGATVSSMNRNFTPEFHTTTLEHLRQFLEDLRQGAAPLRSEEPL